MRAAVHQGRGLLHDLPQHRLALRQSVYQHAAHGKAMVEEVLRGPHGMKLPTAIPAAYDMAGFGSYVGGGREVPRGAAEPHLWDTVAPPCPSRPSLAPRQAPSILASWSTSCTHGGTVARARRRSAVCQRHLSAALPTARTSTANPHPRPRPRTQPAGAPCPADPAPPLYHLRPAAACPRRARRPKNAPTPPKGPFFRARGMNHAIARGRQLAQYMYSPCRLTTFP